MEKENLQGELKSLEGLFKSTSLPVNLSELKTNVPRVNLKKLKISVQDKLDNLLRQKNVTRVYLDEKLFSLDFDFKRGSGEDAFSKGRLSILRKKNEPKEKEEQVTFNMEAEAAQDENIIYSPSDISMPPLKEDVVSLSGEKDIMSWPPHKEEDIQKGEKETQKKEKPAKKPYFLSIPEEEISKEPPEIKEASEKTVETKKEEETKETKQDVFPWVKAEDAYEDLESIFRGGLESELLDIPEFTESKKEEVVGPQESSRPDFKVEEEKLEKSTPKAPTAKVPHKEDEYKETSGSIRAFMPEITGSNIHVFDGSTLLLGIGQSLEEEILQKGAKIKGKAGEMFGNFKLSPISIAIIGGAAITLGYLYLSSNNYLNFLSPSVSEKSNIQVRSIFKPQHLKKKSLDIDSKKESKVSSMVPFNPISEEQRLTLIQKAKEAIESRLDPFGIESILPALPPSKKEDKEKEEPIKDISLQRKQVELVGVISAENKNLALLNIYTVDYTVPIESDKETREKSLKDALSMSVPNRLEVSILDPVEDWYVKQISKSKTRGEDPTIILVKGNQQFTLRVGQKVLLPEEVTFEELKTEIEEKQAQKENALEELGLSVD